MNQLRHEASHEADPKAALEEVEKDADDYRKIAERRVRLGLLLSEIGSANGVDVSDQEMRNLIAQAASQYQGQDRDRFLREVTSQNLSLKAEEASSDAAREGATGIALPPPMAAITQMSDQSGKASNWEISQTLPFPTKLSNDHSARASLADSRNALFTARSREILADAKLLYFRLWRAE